MFQLLKDIVGTVAGWGREVVGAWRNFWFRPGDPTTLGAMRILTGVLLVYMHVIYGLNMEAMLGEHAWLDLETANAIRLESPWVVPTTTWEDPPLPPPSSDPTVQARTIDYYKKWNVNPHATLHQGNYVFSLWFHITDPNWMQATHALVLFVMVLFTVGLWTRVTSVLTWIATLCYINRASTMLFGVDTMIAIGTLYLMIGPCGAALSLDRLIARYRATRQALGQRRAAPEFGPPEPSISATFATRLFQLHFAIIYLAAGVAKLQGVSWWNGTALWQTSANFEFFRPRWEFYTQGLLFLTEHRWLWELVLGGGAIYTLALELSFPFLVWRARWRWPMILAACALHIGIGMLMVLWTFSFMMMIMLMSFVPPEQIRWLLGKLGGRSAGPLRLYYHRWSPAQNRRVSWIHALDVWNRLTLATSPEPRNGRTGAATPETPMYLLTSDGRILTGYGLWRQLTRSLRLLWPFALLTWIPGVGALGRWLAPETHVDPAFPPAEAATPRSAKTLEAAKSGV
jgi:hypothetical protein